MVGGESTSWWRDDWIPSAGKTGIQSVEFRIQDFLGSPYKERCVPYDDWGLFNI